MAGSKDEYGDYGSVPNSVPLQGSGAGPLAVRASPEDFGAQVGAGVQKVGAQAEDLSKQYGDMVNETLMTKADTAFATRLGQLKADLQSKSGLAAFNAYPQYQKDVAQAFQDSRANLPMGAQRGFDMLGARTMANHIADASSFAASQLKEQQRYDGADLKNQAIQSILQLPPQGAADPNRVDEHIGHAIYGLQKEMDPDHPGLKVDPTTGEKSFDESTPEGKGLKAQYEAGVNSIITQAQSNRFDVLAKGDVLGAFNLYQQERPNFPKQTQITLDAKFEPLVFNAHVDNAQGHTIAQSQDDYSRMLYNPASKISDAIFSQESGNKFGSQMSSSGAIGGAQIMPATFAQYAKPGEDINNPEDNKAVGQRIIDNYTKKYNGDAARVATAYFSGPGNVAPEGSPTPWIKDTVDTDGKSVSSYVGDVTSRLGSQPQKSYATNPDGSMFTQADYYRTHSEDVFAKGDAYAEATMPGDLAFKRAVRENLNNYMTKVKGDQQQQYMMDNKNVMRGITGELTKGNAPATEQELRAIPGMNDLLNRVAAQDPKFAETIPNKIAQAQKQNITTNSPNGYETITRVLEPKDSENPNAIKGQDQLDRLMGRSDGTGINMKDYQDAKPATELPSDIKEPLLKHMREIATANGNVDGKGQQRAVQWYNQIMDAYKKNEAMGDKKDSDFVSKIGQADGPLYAPPAPSRITQWGNAIKEATGMGQVLVTNPDGQQGYMPAANVEKYLKLGYKKVE